ncbi:MAG: TatD family hydrolase [Candidatus Eremiobacteraeota bacterium]|nr:TatD family hydrolase [Candidatus Eremiobacteraeota bacterium]MBV8433442.1 TatD family hydrolase [Candidatus Eremiobacteraeota bacterium]MBV8723014.1 TatD family hydrolase [Candidatus Eremiobacteraeota bacterium]
MIDTHCHLQDKQYDGDREQTIARAYDAGLTAMVLVGCDLEDSRRAIEIAKHFSLSASAGIHPHEAKNAPENLTPDFGPLLIERCVVAIGETGLDYYYDHSPREAQARVLRAQLRLARERGLPVIFHQRDAFDDFVAILREEFVPGEMRGVVHCFTGNAEQARTLVGDFDLRLGIGGVVTFSKADALRAAVRAVGIENVVLETDCPYLAPMPVRGRRNEPAYLRHTADKLAEVLAIGFEEIVATTDRNAYTLFGV